MKKEYVLKHKNIPVLIFFMDDETHKLLGTGGAIKKILPQLPAGSMIT